MQPHHVPPSLLQIVCRAARLGVVRWVWRCVALLCLLHGAVQAQGIETIMAPGKVIAAHEKVEADCAQCHVKFDRKAQPRQCMACHKEVGADVRNRTGYHGRLSETACATCHTDHKGRGARIVQLDEKKFDHTRTDYTLRGSHQQVACQKCHQAGRPHREAPQECVACHRKDDTHKGSLGSQCADCHGESRWKDTRFDHDSTRFALTGKHADTRCADCHRDNHYKDTPRTCVACHRKVDEQKGHRGQFGEKCDSCHTTREWKPSTFRHDVDTRYMLRFRHREAKCVDCHAGPIYRDKLSQDCYACHRKDDKHQDSLGRKCEGCHSEKSWKEPPKFDHAKSEFPLRGRHEKVDCKDCHKSPLFRQTPKECVACHEKDDRHRQTLGRDCAACHGEDGWKRTEGRFDHGRTRFPLVHAHGQPSVQCNACHKDLQSMRHTPMACVACHKKDDRHQGQLGEGCERCHSDRAWKEARFDHSQSRFPLTGRHQGVACKGCHDTPRYKDAPRACVSCHTKQDKHLQKFGMQCESCHNTRSWTTWTFDHAARTRYALEGAHARVPCERCHVQPAPAGKPVAALSQTCLACHRDDDAHDAMFGQRCEQCHTVQGWKTIRSRGARP